MFKDVFQRWAFHTLLKYWLEAVANQQHTSKRGHRKPSLCLKNNCMSKDIKALVKKITSGTENTLWNVTMEQKNTRFP